MVDSIWPVDAVSGAPLYTGRKLRQTASPLLAGATAARPLGSRSGVRPGTSPTTVTATATTWTCGPVAGVADKEAAAEAGSYQFAFDQAVSGALTAANASNPRVDIVWIQIDDPAEGDSTSLPTVRRGYTAGSAVASPVAPAAPARSFVIAKIQVPRSGTGSPTVQWVAPYAVAAGARYIVQDSDDLNTYPADLGALALMLSNGITYRGDGTTWKEWESDWISYTPTLSVATGTTKWVGTTGTFTAQYKYAAGRVWVRAKFTFGNTIASTYSNPQFALPVQATNFYVANQFINSTVTAANIGVAIFSGLVRFSSATTAGFAMVATSGAPAGLGPTNPATWGAGDFVSCDFIYDPA